MRRRHLGLEALGTAQWIVLLVAGVSACRGGEAAERSSSVASDTSVPASSGSASAADSAPKVSSAAASPFTVAAEFKSKLDVFAVQDGVWVGDASGANRAIARTGGKLEAAKALANLPKNFDHVRSVNGRLSSLWISVENKKEDDKKKAETPLLRLTSNRLSGIADDWAPLVVPWTKHRTLAISTSSGRLKIKLVEPFTKSPHADQPSRYVPDQGCAETLKLAEARALPNGEVIAAGRCSMGSEKKGAYVLLRWPVAAPTAAAAAAPSSSPVVPRPAVEGSSAPGADSAEPGANSPSATEESDERAGAPMKIVVVKSGKGRHVALSAQSENEVYVALEDGDNKLQGYVIQGDQVSPFELPDLGAGPTSMAITKSGELWAISRSSVFRKPRGGAWASVPLPFGAELHGLAVDADTVWLAATKSDGGALPGVVLKTGGGETLQL